MFSLTSATISVISSGTVYILARSIMDQTKHKRRKPLKSSLFSTPWKYQRYEANDHDDNKCSDNKLSD